MPTYPSGPTACNSDPSCTPKIDDPGSAGPAVIYAFWGFSFVVFLAFFIYKKLWVAAYHKRVGGLRKSVETSGVELEVVQEIDVQSKSPDDVEVKIVSEPSSSPKLSMLGYRENLFGALCFYLVLAISLLWIILFIVIIVDQYHDCELKSVDAACFYGDYYLFGDYNTNSKYMFTIWCVCLPWYVFMVEKGTHVRNWFRMPVTLKEAEVVLVTSIKSEEQMIVNPSTILTMWLKLVATLSDKTLKHEETVPVVDTLDGERYLEFACTRYVLIEGEFVLPEVVVGPSANQIHEQAKGLDTEEWQHRMNLLGRNKIPFGVSGIFTLIAEELFSYFYLYQLVMYVVWFWFSYLFVACVLFSVVCLSASLNIYIKRQHQVTISSMTKYHTEIEVLRNRVFQEVDSWDLVPGDVVKVRSGEVAPCDMVLVHGSAVCDESGLTGESMPVGKTVLLKSDKTYDPGVHKSSTLFGGTTVLQTGEDEADKDAATLAVVTATGINANKGQLISDILFPTPMSFKYDEELPLVVSILLLYALVAFILSIHLQNNSGATSYWTTKWAYGVFTVSQIVSPLLPIALVVGQTMASRRLKEVGVCCMDPKRIAISGKIRVYCFDKTGTLTKEGLDFLGVQECARDTVLDTNGQQVPEYTFRQVELAAESEAGLTVGQSFENALATCHNLKTLKDSLVGNQVEVKMFGFLQQNKGYTMLQDASGASRSVSRALTHSDTPPKDNQATHKLQICKTFEFDHGRMTMTVIVRDCATQEVSIYCKGSYERIGELCGASNSCPVDYDHVAKGHATAGCYVLGMACRHLGKLSDEEIERITRDSAELDGPLTLIGLVLFRNELKPDSADAMMELKQGDVRNIMLTGDNAQCGCYIARQVGMVEPDKLVLFGDDEKKSGHVTWTVMGGGTNTCSAVEVENYKQQLEELIESGGGGDQMFEKVELAMTQKALDTLTKTGAIRHLLLHCRIYARLRPDGKVAVIDMLTALGLVVGMCGDGGNDCGALRAAHAGMALSEAEASVVSPFTSQTKSIQSVVDLLKEGRAALHTSFASYKFLITYGQLFSVLKLICFYYGVIMCMLDYIMIDGVAVLVVSYVMTLSQPEHVLPNQRPTSSLLGMTSMASVVGMQVINLTFLFSALGLMAADSEYKKWPASAVANSGSWWYLGDNWETTVIFTTVYSQFLTSGVLFSFGSHWRKAVCYNWMLVGFWALAFGFTSFLLLADANSVSDLFHIASRAFGPGTDFSSPVWAAAGTTSASMPSSLRWRLWALIVGCLVCTMIWEKFVVLGHVRDYFKRKHPSKGVALRL